MINIEKNLDPKLMTTKHNKKNLTLYELLFLEWIMGCHTWTHDLKIATDITKTDANQEVIRLLKESDNEIDKDYLENYQAIHILETFIPQALNIFNH